MEFCTCHESMALWHVWNLLQFGREWQKISTEYKLWMEALLWKWCLKLEKFGVGFTKVLIAGFSFQEMYASTKVLLNQLNYFKIWHVLLQLTHWGWVMHVCVDKLTIIGSDNGLLPGRRQNIIWTSVGILLIVSLRTNFSYILIWIQTFSFKKMHLKNVVCKMATIFSCW